MSIGSNYISISNIHKYTKHNIYILLHSTQ